MTEIKIKKSTIVRTIIFAVAVINRFLTSHGSGVSLIVTEETANLFADLFLSIAGAVTLWYNNSFTKEAIAADVYLAELKGEPEPDNEDAIEEE